MASTVLESLLGQLMAPNASNPLQALLMPQFRDQQSATDQALAYRQMLQRRSDAKMRTVDPGTTWGGMDKNAMQPDDVQSYGLYRQLFGSQPENI